LSSESGLYLRVYAFGRRNYAPVRQIPAVSQFPVSGLGLPNYDLHFNCKVMRSTAVR
jgi:hypothetical protein